MYCFNNIFVWQQTDKHETLAKVAKKDNYLGARLTDEAINFLKQDFQDNLSKGIQVSIDVFRNVMLLSLVEIRKQGFTEQEIKTLMQLKNLNQSIDDSLLEIVAENSGANVQHLKKKLSKLGRIEKYIMFEQVGLYDTEELKKRFGVGDWCASLVSF